MLSLLMIRTYRECELVMCHILLQVFPSSESYLIAAHGLVGLHSMISWCMALTLPIPWLESCSYFGSLPCSRRWHKEYVFASARGRERSGCAAVLVVQGWRFAAAAYRVNVKRKPCSRRSLLSMVSQTCDPQSIIQPFMFQARQLLQQVCLSQLVWDDNVTNLPGLELDWEDWLCSLPELEKISVPRWTFPRDTAIRVEIHNFSDACLNGYGACVYARSLFSDDSVVCNLLMGKSRVAPLRGISVPRLELVAAVFAAKLSFLVCREIDMHIDAVYLWTDASVALRYIWNTSTRFETFVSNRIELLDTLISIEQWRYLPSKQNPAGNFQFCTHRIVIYIYSTDQKSKILSLLIKILSFSSWSDQRALYVSCHGKIFFFTTF